MDEFDWKKPALIGGLISGISAIPYLNMMNVCLCLWAWIGGIVAAKLLIGRSQRIVTSKDGARIGLYAGLIAGVIVLVITTPLTLWQMDQLLQRLIAFTANAPDAQSFYARVQDDPALKLMFSFIIGFVSAILVLGFTVLGGLVGVALFEKRKGQTPPPPQFPPAYPPNYPPNYPPQSGGPGGDQRGWPQA
jgi:hypothetical protein